MNKYKTIKFLAMKEGVDDALHDIKYGKVKTYKKVDKIKLLSKLYDSSYIDAYNQTINKHLNNKKANN